MAARAATWARSPSPLFRSKWPKIGKSIIRMSIFRWTLVVPSMEQAGGLTHFTVWLDARTRAGYLFFSKDKNSQIAVRQTEKVDNLARKTGDGVRIVHVDSHPAWRCERWKIILEQRGIVPQFAEVHGHGQIGLVERLFRTIQERSTCSMIHSGVPKRLFFYAVRHFYYHWMRDESAGISRWEKFSGEKLETKFFTLLDAWSPL